MDTPGWLSRQLADVPDGDGWLGPEERRVLARLARPPRRAAWRLGRFTAKAAVGDWLVAAPERIEILAAEDGAPEAWLDGERLPVSVSISHRGDRAVAIVCGAPGVVGCDLELIEPRSDAFVREWLAPEEQRLLHSCPLNERPLLANLIWSAKEAAAKVLRAGLRLNVRAAVVTAELDGAAGWDGAWRPLRVQWLGPRSPICGWWRHEGEWVITAAGEPGTFPPRALSAAAPVTPCAPSRCRC
jgi:4'-phosphopantetheinyl transferase